MKLFKLPLMERSTNLNGSLDCFGKCKSVCVDDVGLFVYYSDEDSIYDENIRHHLCGRRSTFCYVEAKSLKEAILKFYAEWDGARVGGPGRESKALWIDLSHPAEFIVCKRKMHLRENGTPICGEERDYGWTGCKIDDCDIEECKLKIRKIKLNSDMIADREFEEADDMELLIENLEDQNDRHISA
jgi:hypothetical protein